MGGENDERSLLNGWKYGGRFEPLLFWWFGSAPFRQHISIRNSSGQFGRVFDCGFYHFNGCRPISHRGFSENFAHLRLLRRIHNIFRIYGGIRFSIAKQSSGDVFIKYLNQPCWRVCFVPIRHFLRQIAISKWG